MKVPDREDQADHVGPESWGGGRKAAAQALTGGVQAGLLSLESTYGVPVGLCAAPAISDGPLRQTIRTPRGQRTHAYTQAPHTEAGRSQGRPRSVKTTVVRVVKLRAGRRR